MPNAVIIPNEKSKYAENLFPYKSTLNELVTINTTDGADNAVVDITNVSVPLYNRLNVVRAIFTDTGVCTFNLGDALEFVVPTTGTYILSMRIFVPSIYSSATIYGKWAVFANLALEEFNYTTDNSQFVFGQWNTFSQVVELTQGDDFTCAIKTQSDTLGSRIYFGGFDIKLDDRGLQGVTPFYSEPHNPTYSQTNTIDIPSISSNSSYEVTTELIGAKVGDFVGLIYPSELITLGLSVTTPLVTENDEVKFIIHNHSGGSVNPSSGSYTLKTIK
jgi:hypothetical protein